MERHRDNYTRAALLLLGATSAAAVCSAQGRGELKLLPHDGGYADEFGISTSIYGSRALVGAWRFDDTLPDIGAAYIFDAATGQELLQLTARNPYGGDRFGASVSLFGDLALIGAYDHTHGGYTNGGAAYVFDAITGTTLRKLLPQDPGVEDRFGSSVSLYGDLALVGSPGDDDNGIDAGSAYLFDATTGQQLQKLLPADPDPHDTFGSSVSLTSSLALVGAQRDSVHGPQSGSAYLFDIATGQQLHKLVPQDGQQLDWFGTSVAISGNLALVGAPQDDVLAVNSGSAYLFDTTTGQEVHKLVPQDLGGYDVFGGSVALSGEVALIGAQLDSELATRSGSAYVFDVPSGQQLYEILPQDGGYNNYFGKVALFGNRALIGAPRDDDNGVESGSAYLFDISGTGPGVGYCFGDPGGVTPCPCGNNNDGSVPGSGCRNGVFPAGARLTGSGTASVSNDSLVLSCSGLEPGNSAFYFQADRALAPAGLLGDGLRCAGGNLKRLQFRLADASGSSGTTIGISARAGNVVAGDTKFYQCWYRTTTTPPCGLGVNDFNASNGYALTWIP